MLLWRYEKSAVSQCYCPLHLKTAVFSRLKSIFGPSYLAHAAEDACQPHHLATWALGRLSSVPSHGVYASENGRKFTPCTSASSMLTERSRRVKCLSLPRRSKPRHLCLGTPYASWTFLHARGCPTFPENGRSLLMRKVSIPRTATTLTLKACHGCRNSTFPGYFDIDVDIS